MDSAAIPADDFIDRRAGIHPDQLAVLVGSRLCHDIISPLGAIGNGVELLQISGEFPTIARSAEMQLIVESIEAARSRIGIFRMAFGHTSAEQRVSGAEFESLLQGYDRNGRLRISFDPPGDLPRIDARLIVLGLMCLETAMAWGGRVLVCRGEQGWRLVAETSRIKADAALWMWLDQGSEPLADINPSEVHFALLSELVRSHDRSLRWELDEAGGEIAFF